MNRRRIARTWRSAAPSDQTAWGRSVQAFRDDLGVIKRMVSAPVSNQDDVLGRILLAKEKVTHEALHDAELRIDGVDAFDVTGRATRKIYRGQQLALFGRYDGHGEADVRLDAALTGPDVSYEARFEFPARTGADDAHPELERLWALARIEEIESLMRAGLLDASEGESAVEDLGVEYQIVTDETSMVVLDDAAFEEHGIERRNRERVAREREARARRSAAPIRRHRADGHDPMFDGRTAPSAGNGAGAFGLVEALLMLLAGGGLAMLGALPGGGGRS